MSDGQTNWIDFFIALAPVAQTAIWACVVTAGVLVFRTPLRKVVDELVKRLNQGDKLTTPWLSLERLQEREGEVVKQVTENLRKAVLNPAGKESKPLSATDEAKLETFIDEVNNNFVTLRFPASQFKSRFKQHTELSLYMTDWNTVSDFLNDAYLAATGRGLEIPVWSYGLYWQFKNERTGKILEKSKSGAKPDNRSFSVLGVQPGDILTAERIGSAP